MLYSLTYHIKNALKSMTLVPVANKTPVEHELLTLLENLSSTHILDDVCVVHLKIFVFVYIVCFCLYFYFLAKCLSFNIDLRFVL